MQDELDLGLAHHLLGGRRTSDIAQVLLARLVVFVFWERVGALLSLVWYALFLLFTAVRFGPQALYEIVERWPPAGAAVDVNEDSPEDHHMEGADTTPPVDIEGFRTAVHSLKSSSGDIRAISGRSAWPRCSRNSNLWARKGTPRVPQRCFRRAGPSTKP